MTNRSSQQKTRCPVTQGQVDLSSYEKSDGYWREIGIAAPARRGLVDNKLLKLSDLKKVSENEFLDIHGMGPKAATIIRAEMKRKGVKFRPERSRQI